MRRSQTYYLPQGGTFELPLPGVAPSEERFMVHPKLAGAEVVTGTILPILLGGILGAALTWGALKVFR